MEYYAEKERTISVCQHRKLSNHDVEWGRKQNNTQFGTLMQILTMHFKSYTYFYGYAQLYRKKPLKFMEGKCILSSYSPRFLDRT